MTGSDLARAALRSAVAATRRMPQEPSAQRDRPARAASSLGVVGLQTAVDGLLVDRAWTNSAAGGDVLRRWPSIAPELAGHVAAVGYDPAAGRLSLRPGSAAYATQLRLLTPMLVDRINTAMGVALVRTIAVLASGPIRDAPSAPVPVAPAHPDPAVGPSISPHAAAMARRAREVVRRAGGLADPGDPLPSVRAWQREEGPTVLAQPSRAPDSHARALARARAERRARAAT